MAERLRRIWRSRATASKDANITGRLLYRESDVERWINEQFEQALSEDHESGSRCMMGPAARKR